MTGLIVEVCASSEVDPGKLRAAEALLDSHPLLDPPLLQLLNWVAGYYIHPPGEVLQLALAPRERRGEPPAATGIPGLKLSLRGSGLPDGALKRAPKQAMLLKQLQAAPLSLDATRELGISSAVVRELIDKGLAERCDLHPPAHWDSRDALTANPEQRLAIDAIVGTLGEFCCHLLQGVTGSGKTEVYLQAISATLAQGRQALVLLPEIALTPQMVERFRARFAAPVVELHSGLSDGVRDRNWAAAREGHAAIVIGTRSAVFTPLLKPGLIVVDEEHETTFTQQDGLRYSARDVAVKRGQIYGIPVVLGSATPSLETLDNVERGRFRRSLLTARAGQATLPDREIIDIRALALEGGASNALLNAVRDTVDRGEQALLFLNRRGFAPSLTCHDCGWTAECQHCDARMTIHRRPARLQCHHCGAGNHLPASCPSCHSRRLVAAGVGTEQAEQVIASHFSDQPIYRVDSDSVRTRQAMVSLREQLAEQRSGILIGTQMLAKGHDFPNVTLVGVVDADALLFSPDFRGEERLAQLVTQVAGRAGRGQRPGRVLIQTRHPEHPLMAGLLTADYESQARLMLAERRQRGLPPAGALALLRADSKRAADGIAFLAQLGHAAAPTQLAGCRLVGPLATPMARRAGMSRAQLVISGPSRTAVGAATRHLVSVAQTLKSSGVQWFADVDPIDPI